jgi:hypothetical protein
MSSDSTLSIVEERAFEFAEAVLKQAAAFVDAVVAEVMFEDNADPKLYGVALLCRSISNFQGALTMARNDQAVESRTLARSCLENLFLIDDLRQRGSDSVKNMRSHDASHKISLGKMALKQPGVGDGPLARIFENLIQRESLKKPKRLSVRGTAKGEIARMYAYYALLSHDAAHPSVTALDRHFPQVYDGHRTAIVVPPFKPEERLATVDMACDALLGACLGVGAMLGGTSQDDALAALWGNFVDQGLTCGGAGGATGARMR